MRVRIVTELSFYLENRPGILAQMTTALAHQKVNVEGLQTYDGSVEALVLLVVDKPDLAEQILRDELQVEILSRTDILEIDIINQVGGLAEIANLFAQHDINIKSIYSIDGHETSTPAFVRVDDVEKSQQLLNQALGYEPVQRSIAIPSSFRQKPVQLPQL